jgi:hypothetical protein
MNLSLTSSLKSIAVLTACSFMLQAELPEAWHLAGSAPRDYDCTIDSLTPYNGEQSTYLKGKEGAALQGFGTLMRSYSPGPYLGKRVRFSANVKADSVKDWAGLWMRVDDANHKTGENPSVLAFDNMQSRPIKGTFGWRSFSVVLDVSEEATGISLGILLSGGGSVWLNGAKIEVVGTDVATTGMSRSNKKAAAGPTNLSFEDK